MTAKGEQDPVTKLEQNQNWSNAFQPGGTEAHSRSASAAVALSVSVSLQGLWMVLHIPWFLTSPGWDRYGQQNPTASPDTISKTMKRVSMTWLDLCSLAWACPAVLDTYRLFGSWEQCGCWITSHINVFISFLLLLGSLPAINNLRDLWRLVGRIPADFST